MRIVCTLIAALSTPMVVRGQTPVPPRPPGIPGPRVLDPGGQLLVDPSAIEVRDLSAPVKDAPFSAEAMTEIVQTLSDGNRIIRRTTASLYRDSRGRTRREVRLEGIAGVVAAGSPLQIVTVSDPDSGLTYIVDADQQLRVWRSAPGDPRPVKTPPEAPPGRGDGREPQPLAGAQREEALGKRTIEGLECIGSSTTVTIPAGAIGNERAIESVTERWFSPALQLVVYSRRRDPRFGETTYRLTKISRAEPPATLFESPRR